MALKKELETKRRLDDRKFFQEVGVKSSDVYYVNDDKVEKRKQSLRGGAREVANMLNEEINQGKNNYMKTMTEQAAKRLEELEKMKQDEISGRNQKQDDKKKLLEIQREDQSLKNADRANYKKMAQSVSFENSNVLSYVFEQKEHKALRYNRRIESIYNHYSDKLTMPLEE